MTLECDGELSPELEQQVRDGYVPYIEWVIYEDMSNLSRPGQWARACATRKGEAFDQLLEQLKGPQGMATSASRVLIVLTWRPLPEPPRTQQEMNWERIYGASEKKEPQFAEGQTLFLAPFKFIPESAIVFPQGPSR